MEYFIHLAILVCIYLILAQSFNVSFGLGRLFNLGHIAFYALGAYTTALLSTDLQQSFWVCVPASMLLSGLLALLVAAISLKLSDDYFAIGSLAFHAVLIAILINWRDVTRGVLGIPGIPRPAIFGLNFYENLNFLLLIGSVVLISFAALYLLFRSGYARQLAMLSEHEHAAQALAVNTRKVRTLSIVISSVFAGLAGSFFAYYINYIDPSSFGLYEMVFVLSIVIVGRPGSFWGVALSTVFLVLLPEPLRFLEISPSILGPMRQLLYALVLFAVVYWKREQIFPLRRLV